MEEIVNNPWLFGLFSLGVVWTGILLSAFILWMIYLVDTENAGAAFVWTLIVLALFHAGGVLNVWGLFQDPLKVATFIAVYLLLGIIWAVVKWNFYVAGWRRDTIAHSKNVKETFFREYSYRGPQGIYAGLSPEDAWLREKESLLGTSLVFSPEVVRDKGKLITWAVYWPFSCIWTMIDDPIRRFYGYILVYVIGAGLQRVADRNVNVVKEEIEKL
jgi:hypothetical protein